jgi:hypothetical protein
MKKNVSYLIFKGLGDINRYMRNEMIYMDVKEYSHESSSILWTPCIHGAILSSSPVLSL